MEDVQSGGEANSRKRQARKSKQRLIRAAGKMFARRGYSESSVAAIGKAAGMSRGLVNFHFGSKESLLLAVVDDVIADWEREVFGSAASAGGGIDAVREVLLAHRRILIEQPDRARLIYRLLVEALDERRGLAERFAATLTRWRALTLPWWQQAVEKGEVDPGLDHSAVVALVLGGLRGIALDWLLAPNSFDLDEAYAMLWRSFARGVAP